MAEVKKMVDMPASVALFALQRINNNKVFIRARYRGRLCDWSDGMEPVIVTDTEPEALVYPEGWYYNYGVYMNRHIENLWSYKEINMYKSNGEYWGFTAKYATLE